MQVPLHWLILIGLAVFARQAWAQEHLFSDSIASTVLDRGTLVIFPPEIRASNPRAPVLGAAIYERIVAQISMIEGLYVVAGDELRPYLDSGRPRGEIAHLVGARTYFVSNVSMEDGSWSLSMELEDAAFGECTVENSAHCISSLHIGSGSAKPDSNGSLAMPSWEVLPEFAVSRIETKLFPDRAPDPATVFAEERATVLDVSRSDRERIEAFDRLAGPRMGSPEGAYSEKGLDRLRGPIAQAAAAIGLNSDDARIRARAWTELTSVDDPYLIRPLLDALANDPAEDARVAAARALKYFLDDTQVREALGYASSYDTSESVRAQAIESLTVNH